MNVLSASLFEPAPPLWIRRMLAVFRIVASLTFVTAGTTKLFGYPPSPVSRDRPGSRRAPDLLRARRRDGGRPFSSFTFQPRSSRPRTNGIPAVLYCFFFLYLKFAGAGAWSIDARIAGTNEARGSGDSHE